MYLLTFRIVSKGDNVHYANQYLDRVKLKREYLEAETRWVAKKFQSPNAVITYIKELEE